MYRSVVLALYGGRRARTAGALTVTRYTDHTLKRISLGRVHCSEKKSPPNDQVTSKPPTSKKSPEDRFNATSAVEEDMPHNKDSSQPPQKENLQQIISGMKVQVRAPERFLAINRGKKEQMKWAQVRDELQSSSNMFQMASTNKQPSEKVVDPEMAAAVSAVALTFPDKKNEVQSELLQRLLLHKETGNKQEKGDINIRNVLSGMKLKRDCTFNNLKDARRKSRQEQIYDEETRKRPQKRPSDRLHIFSAPLASQETTITESESSPTLWDLELAKEIATSCEKPFRNGFEEMIQWTNEGKLWTFPINNEAGLDEEQNVEFHEHVFLDKYLEDFPKQGPIRHFMELVVCGLSKNPCLTVQQKKEHIDWFLDYFKQKEEILKECDVYLN